MKKEPLFFFKKKFMGSFIVVIMILSLAGVFTTDFDEGKKAKEINGKLFYPYQEGWFTYINNQQIGFSYLPDELEDIQTIPYINFDSQKVYLIIDPTIKNLTFDSSKQRLAYFLDQKNILSVNACNQEQNCPDSMPIKNCEDINEQAILLKSGSKPRIYKDYMCYVIEADTSLNLFKVSEKLIYQMLGVI